MEITIALPVKKRCVLKEAACEIPGSTKLFVGLAFHETWVFKGIIFAIKREFYKSLYKGIASRSILVS